MEGTNVPRTAAEREEQAELNLLREQAERAAAEAAETYAELTRRVTVARVWRPALAAVPLLALAAALLYAAQRKGRSTRP